MEEGHRPPRHRESEDGGPVLIVIDMLNQYEHEDADRLAASVEPTIPAIQALLDCARDDDVPVIYVNDNYGAWQ
jgi:nicotinamidase-related amidase